MNINHQNNSGQRFNNQSSPINSLTGSRPLREQRINPKHLSKVNPSDLEFARKDGSSLEISVPKQRATLAYTQPDSNDIDIQFHQPKKAYFDKKQVFLPDKDMAYNDIRALIDKLPFQNLINKANGIQPSNNVFVNSGVPNPLNQQPRSTSQVRTKRIIHKLNGEVVEEEV